MQQELQAIINHGQASGTDDFEQVENGYNISPLQDAPRFLQPEHQPQLQLPLPSMMHRWSAAPYAQPFPRPISSINPEFIQDPFSRPRLYHPSVNHGSNQHESSFQIPHELQPAAYSEAPLCVGDSSPTQLPPFSGLIQQTSQAIGYAGQPGTPLLQGHYEVLNRHRLVDGGDEQAIRPISLRDAWGLAQQNNAVAYP